MRYSRPIALGVIAAMTCATAALTQTARPPAKPIAAPAYTAGAFTPGFDDLMTMLVQPRHIKLYYAGAARNWELAAAQSRDLRASFGRIAQAIASYQGNDVAGAAGNFAVPQLDAVDAAIAAGVAPGFTAAYAALTKGCNECHAYMEHPFLVIKVPEAPADSAHPDQEYRPMEE